MTANARDSMQNCLLVISGMVVAMEGEEETGTSFSLSAPFLLAWYVDRYCMLIPYMHVALHVMVPFLPLPQNAMHCGWVINPSSQT